MISCVVVGWYTIMPAAVIHGLTESASWAGSSVYVSYLGEQYWERIRTSGHIKKHSRESCVYSFFCQFYTIEYMALVSSLLFTKKGVKGVGL